MYVPRYPVPWYRTYMYRLVHVPVPALAGTVYPVPYMYRLVHVPVHVPLYWWRDVKSGTVFTLPVQLTITVRTLLLRGKWLKTDLKNTFFFVKKYFFLYVFVLKGQVRLII